MRNSLRTLLVITILVGAVPPAPAQTTNEKVVQFCKDNLGKKVGAGECADLAASALKQAGAKPRGKDFPNSGDYVWGTLVYTLENKDNALKETKSKMNIQPGDVMQLRDATFQGKNLRGLAIYAAVVPHHTAIVVAVNKKANVITALEQNYNGKRFVVQNPYRLTDLKAGWVRIYRPVPE